VVLDQDRKPSPDGRALALPGDVRARPGMFVGAVDASGILQLIMELVGNAIEHNLAGQASLIQVEVHDDHFCVSDDGPGVAAGELVPGSSGTPSWWADLRLGLVNSLARRLELETCRHGARRRWCFEDTAMIVDGERLGRCSTRGTTVRVWPDPRVFQVTRPERFELEERLLGVHRVRPSLAVELDRARFDEPSGSEAWVAAQRACRGHAVRHLEARLGTTEVDLAWALLPPFGSARCLSYVNLEETDEDGSHVEGLLSGLAQAHDLPLALVRERTLALVSVIAVNPRFAGSTRARLHDPTLQRWIAELVEQHARKLDCS
jgi:DNA gyrase/topoisomerase IV subunit B